MSSAKGILEKVTLGIGVVGAIVVAVGIGFKLGDYALDLIQDSRPAKSDVVPKPPTFVKGEVEESDIAQSATATAMSGESGLIRVVVPLSSNDEVGKICGSLKNMGYESYALPDGDGIQVGAFKDRTKATALADILEDSGIRVDLR